MLKDNVFNILVTGSSGYIGSSFIDTYNQYKYINFSLQKDSIENINFHNIDIVLHCAALVHKKTEFSYEQYYEINVEYPLNLAKKAKACGVKQFVFISTIAVYGEDKQLLLENTNCSPVTSYGKSKLEAEKQLLALENNNFVVSIIRPPMVYGKNAPGNIDSLIKLVKRVSVLPFGKITNKRSFVYIGNLCHLIYKVIEKGQSGIFLASDDEPISTTKLIELIAKNLDKRVYLLKIQFFETLLNILKPSFHKRLYENLEVDNCSTKDILGLKNPYSVEDGIRYMLQKETK